MLQLNSCDDASWKLHIVLLFLIALVWFCWDAFLNYTFPIAHLWVILSKPARGIQVGVLCAAILLLDDRLLYIISISLHSLNTDVFGRGVGSATTEPTPHSFSLPHHISLYLVTLGFDLLDVARHVLTILVDARGPQSRDVDLCCIS